MDEIVHQYHQHRRHHQLLYHQYHHRTCAQFNRQTDIRMTNALFWCY